MSSGGIGQLDAKGRQRERFSSCIVGHVGDDFYVKGMKGFSGICCCLWFSAEKGEVNGGVLLYH